MHNPRQLQQRLETIQLCLQDYLHSRPVSRVSLHLFRPDMLELLWCVKEVVGVGLGGDFSRVGLLNEVLVTLLLGKVNGVLLVLEVDVGALHEIGRRLPAHQRVLPSVALGEDIPVHSPALAPPGSGLSCGLGLLVNSVKLVNTRSIPQTRLTLKLTELFEPGAPWEHPRLRTQPESLRYHLGLASQRGSMCWKIVSLHNFRPYQFGSMYEEALSAWRS